MRRKKEEGKERREASAAGHGHARLSHQVAVLHHEKAGGTLVLNPSWEAVCH